MTGVDPLRGFIRPTLTANRMGSLGEGFGRTGGEGAGEIRLLYEIGRANRVNPVYESENHGILETGQDRSS